MLPENTNSKMNCHPVSYGSRVIYFVFIQPEEFS